MNIKEKNNEIERTLPLLWSSYQHMYDVRVNGINNSVNFLLVVLSFLSAITTSLFIFTKNKYFLFPLSILIITLFILIKTFFIYPKFHWFKLGDYLEEIEKKDFNINLIASLKALENDTHIYLKYVIRILTNSLYLLTISIIFIVYILMKIYIPIKYFSFSLILLSILIICFCIYIKLRPKWEYEKINKESLKEINNWIHKDN